MPKRKKELPTSTTVSPTLPKQINLYKALAAENAEFVAFGPKSDTIIAKHNETGEERIIDVADALKRRGLAINQVRDRIIYNTVDNPVGISPVSAETRLNWDLGTPKGVMESIAKSGEFDRVYPHDEHGLLLRKNGVWSKVDPGLLETLQTRDPWTIAKEFWADFNELMPEANEITAAAAGAIKGGALAAPLGPVAAIGGAVLGSGIGAYGASIVNTVLGKIKKTYKATPEEEIGEYAWDTAAAMSGNLVGPGAKLGYAGLIKMAKFLKNSPIGDISAVIMGHLTKTKTGGMRLLMDRTEDLMRVIKNATRQAGEKVPLETAIFKTKEKAITKAEEFLNMAQRALPKKWGEEFQKLVVKAKDRMPAFDIEEMAKRVAAELEEKGFGKIDIVDDAAKGKTQIQNELLKARDKIQTLLGKRAELIKTKKAKLDSLSQGKEVIGQGQTLADLTTEIKVVERELQRLQRGSQQQLKNFKATPRKPRLVFREFTPEEIAERRLDETSQVVGPDEVKAINNALNSFNRRMGAKNLKGERAAKVLTAIQKEINLIEGDISATKLVSKPSIGRAVSQINDTVRSAVKDKFRAAGLGQEHQAMSDVYKRYGDAVKEARKIIQRKGSVEAFTDKLGSEAGRNVTPRGIAEQLVDLAGPEGNKLFKEIALYDTAAKFLPWAPNLGLIQTGTVLTGLAQVSTGSLLAAIPTVALGTQFSPRIVANEISLLTKLGQVNKMFKLLPKEQMLKLTGNRAAFTSIFKNIIDTMQMEDGIQQEIKGKLNGR